MAKVLLTGGSGFIAAHVLNALLHRGYTVVTTVRSKEKGDQILAAHTDVVAQSRLTYAIVSDISQKNAFDSALANQPGAPFDYVIHTASPFPASFENPLKDVLEPAVNGTNGILQSVKQFAPSVKRVVITSSFAAMLDHKNPPKTYDETVWNPVTWDEAVNDHSLTYRGSKTFAERAAWDFVEKEKPNFDVVALNPPMVYGPVVHHLGSLSRLNTSNMRIRDFIQGKHRDNELPPTRNYLFTDVRDLALAHVKAIEVPEAGGKRFFVTAGHYTNKRIVDAIRETHPELSSRLAQNPIDDLPADVYGYDNSRVKEVLGIEFRSLKECIGDATTSLLEEGA
ncbi:unnamed protein product [Clonostachys rosea]|uniref:NAD-dependent epimerase/dehydratase domain-containing protein n=1 Tax=Bionectria ochroleuca TaxID=29856 RepID=A0ABY6UIP3_BIOOC|nr:unnamed protein product [Clonostachys rosea]